MKSPGPSVFHLSFAFSLLWIGGLSACGQSNDGGAAESEAGTESATGAGGTSSSTGVTSISSSSTDGSGSRGPNSDGSSSSDSNASGTGGIRDGGHPNIFLNQAEIDGILAKINEGEEPWLTARDDLLGRATVALDEPLRSVTFGGPNVCGGNNVYCYDEDDVHDWKDGAEPLSEAIRDLGMGYAFSGDARYAEKAIELLNTWAVNPDTAMQPRFSGSQTQIQLYSVMGGFFYGADLIYNYPGWDLAERDALQEWVRAFGTDGMNAGVGDNNFANWKNAFVAAAGAFSEDQELLDYAFQRYEDMIPIQIDGSGRMGWEYGRETGAGGLHYSMYAIHAMTQCAEVARHQGLDLYGYTDSRGVGLENALDFMAPYVEEPTSWPYYGEIHSGNGPGVFEVAYSRWQKTAYLGVITEWNRPFTMSLGWAFGAVTLTHGRTPTDAAYPM